MAKTISTRIKNRIDTISAWQGTGVELLKGEIAIVQVPTGNSYENPVTGATEPEIELLMKVGDGSKSFDNLPWLSAKASDVYDWAKQNDPSSITVKYNAGTDASPTWKTSTLANVLKDLNTASAEIASLKTQVSGKLGDITVSQTGSGVVKSVTKGSTAGSVTVTRGTIAASDIASGAVETAKIKDGAVTNAKVAADIQASKIVYSGSGDNTITVASKLQDLDSQLSSVSSGVLSAISVDPATAGSGVVQGITYANGKFSVSYGTIAADDIASSAVTTAKIKDGNVTTAKLADSAVTDAKIASVSSGKVTVATDKTLLTKLTEVDGEISSIKSAITGGTHFIGEANATPSGTTVTIKTGTSSTKSHTAAVGDIVLYGDKEFIYVATSSWKELGDLGRVGTLETLVGSIQAEEATDNQYVTHIAKDNGRLVAITKQPLSTEIKHGNSSTVSAEFANQAGRITAVEGKLEGVTKVTTSISNAINALDFAEPNDSTATTTDTIFIDSISQTNGKISASKKKLPTASTTVAGIVKLNNTTTSTSTTEAATANTVNTVNTTATDAQTRVAAVEGNYVRFNNDKLYIGTDGQDEIIFDCGGAV